MKKLSYLIALTLILGLVLTGCLLSNVGQVPTTEQSGITYLTKHTEELPFFTDLIADGRDLAIDVGDVLVWNDDTNLCVKYQLSDDAIAEGWFLTETHFAVAGGVNYEGINIVPPTPEVIPQTKKFNPIPGHFDYGDDNLGVYDNGNLIGGPDFYKEGLSLLKLGVESGEEVYIAAHAVVCKLSDVMTAPLVSGTDTQCAGYTTTDPPLAPLAPSNYSLGTWSYAVDLSGPHPGAWYNENTPPFSGAFWISSAVSREGSGLDDQYRLFRDMFEIPAGAVNRQGKLWMSADNDAIAYLDDATNVVGEIEDVYTNSPSGNISPFNEAHYYEFTPGEGWNTLYFVVRNWGWSGGNPTGLLYKMDYQYQLLECCETAWAAGFDFPGKNWATYFTYAVQEMPVVTPGYSGLTEAAGVRYKGNSTGNEIYLGVFDLGVGSNRVELSYPDVGEDWPNGTYAVTFAFDQDENKITTSIDDGKGNSKSIGYDFDDLLLPGCPPANWNTLDILVIDRLTTGAIAFNNVMLDSFSIGNFGTFDVPGAPGWPSANWTVTGFDFSKSFTITGDLVVEGWTGNERNKMQIMVGCLP